MAYERQILDYLIKSGLTPAGACGLMGNLKAESGLVPTNLQNSYNKKFNVSDEEYTVLVDTGQYNNFVKDSAGYGLAQWTYWTRKQGLLELAQSTHRSIGDLGLQLDYLVYELKARKQVWDILSTTTSVETASDIVLHKFEAPADQSNKVELIRRTYGLEYYQSLVGDTSSIITESTNKSDKVVNNMKINIHAGHNPDNKVACGAVGLIKESTEARAVKDLVIDMLRKQGHTVFDCTVDDGTSQNDVLQKIVSKCNSHNVDIDVSIHFNAGAKDLLGNKKVTGTEVFIYDANTVSKTIASRIVNSISALGFTNRGVKISRTLYFLRKTKAPAVLVECCFVDDKDDIDIYTQYDMAKAIVEGIVGTKIPFEKPQGECPFLIQCLEDLNIRKTPAGEIVRAGGCKKGTKYTIVEVSSGWGKLKSGLGWISLNPKYVTRVDK